MKKSFVAEHPQAVRDFVTATMRAADWSAEHPDDARKLVGEILAKRGDNPDLAQYWRGFGLRQHGLFVDHDTQFWLDALIREGRIKPGQFAIEDIATNKYNDLAHLAQQ
jgi:ABC-type nitrate/sulfonate/bicarbonate transport system substrate-binding protein